MLLLLILLSAYAPASGNSGNRKLINKPSHLLRKPNPTAAPKLAMAGKHMAQPAAETSAPIELTLSPILVNNRNILAMCCSLITL